MKTAAALATGLVALAALAEAALGPNYGGELTLGVAALPDSLQPRRPADASQRLLLGLVHETLVTLDEGGRMAPSLARGYTPTSSWREWRFELETEARFHDDASITSQDVLRSLRRYLQDDNPDAAGLRAGLVPEGILTPDATHVVLRFRDPQPEGVPALASPAAAIVSATGAGAGPFFPTLAVPGQRIALTAFSGHVRGRPYLDRLTLLARPDEARRSAEVASRGLDVALDADPWFSFEPARHATLALVLDDAQPPETVAAISAAAAAADLAAFATGAESLVNSQAAGVARLGGVALPLLVADDVPRAASQRLAAVLEARGARVSLRVATPDQVWRTAAPLRLLLMARATGAETPGLVVPLARLPIRIAARPGVQGLRVAWDTRLVLEHAWLEP